MSQPHSLYSLLSVQHRSTVLQTFRHVVVETIDVIVTCGGVTSDVVSSDVVDVSPGGGVVGTSLVVVVTLSVVVLLVVVV